MLKQIEIKGAKVHNLKNIEVEIPRNKFVVITGISGSGKSSLAFDTIYAEGQRRYVESLSAYARQFLGMMDKPDVEQINGLSPAISIDQKATTHNPRSTVGTVTEVYDYLRLLFARIGIPYCPKCGKEIVSQSPSQIADKISKELLGRKIAILAPLVKSRKGEHKNVLEQVKNDGYVRVRVDGDIYHIDEALELQLNRQKKHNIEVVVDRLEISKKIDRSRLLDSIEIALKLGGGTVVVISFNDKPRTTRSARVQGKDIVFSELFACPKCGISLPEIEPRIFSFNSPHGACPACSGLGTKLEVDPRMVIPNKELSIAEGAIKPFNSSGNGARWQYRLLQAVAKNYKFSLYDPVKSLPKKALDIILYGTGEELIVVDDDRFATGGIETTFEGVIPNLERRYRETESDYIRSQIELFMTKRLCEVCKGKRLKDEVLSIKILEKSISEVTEMDIEEALKFFKEAEKKLSPREQKIACQILREIRNRLQFLIDVGVGYLTLDRAAATLSGGEAQRIHLATQIGSKLMGVLYVLDEPSIGLHQRDNDRLIKTLKNLRDIGNTVIVVEHDEATIRAADWLIDIGPGAGDDGGAVVFSGTPEKIKKAKTLTGLYLSGKEKIPLPASYRRGNGKKISIKKAAEHNLKSIDVNIPLGKFVCVTGVSGSGKSTLINDILAKALAREFYNAKAFPGKHQKIVGLSNINKVVNIDQSPIGRTPRSNTATYTGIFTYIRELFAATKEARKRGYTPGRFSFNVKGGRCERCGGAGVERIEMQFLPDVYVECEECGGKRYNKEALEITYRGVNINDVLEMTAAHALEFFQNIPALKKKLQILNDVGLGYIKLGQPATTLSGGEAQRVKLATELSRQATGKTLYILDEPTVGLHFDDVKKLLQVLGRLVDKGNTVIVIEHNLDVIKSADWVIDLGPEGGDKGGFLVAEGTPTEIAKVKESYTGQYLKKVLK